MPDHDFISLVPDQSPHRVVGDRVVMLPGIVIEILTTRCIELQEWDLQGLNDPYWRLYLPISGEALVWIGDGSYRTETRLKPGNAYLISPRTTFSSRNPVAFGKWYVHFTLGHGAGRATPGIFQITMTAAMETALAALKDSISSKTLLWRSVGLVAEGLMQLPDEVWTDYQTDQRLERALEFMHTNLNRKLTLEEVARAAGLSARNLNHLFRVQLDTTPMRALLNFRLDKACQLLRHNNDSIEQIANDTGFPNRYYFSRMLKKYRGTSPAAYRRGQV